MTIQLAFLEKLSKIFQGYLKTSITLYKFALLESSELFPFYLPYVNFRRDPREQVGGYIILIVIIILNKPELRF